jgi:hypothetical protein
MASQNRPLILSPLKKQLLVIHGNTISIAWIFLGGFNLPKQT